MLVDDSNSTIVANAISALLLFSRNERFKSSSLPK